MITRVIPIHDPSGVAEARRVAGAIARSEGFTEEEGGRVALVATELATNVSKHATEGALLVTRIDDAAGPGVECIALDRGPGIADVARALHDGFSTAGSPGTGLGAIRRAAHAFDLYSAPGVGTAVLARLRRGRPSDATVDVGDASIEIPQAGETVSGDAAAVRRTARGCRAMVADGLGHGDGAAVAARGAIDVFANRPWASPGAALASMHQALLPTRGAAVAVADVDLDAGVVTFAGIGNVMAAIVSGTTTRQMVSLHGTVGHSTKRIQQFEYPVAPGALLVMCSDGVLTNWSLTPYPGLANRDPALVAAVIYRDFKRGRDDLTVLVVRVGT